MAGGVAASPFDDQFDIISLPRGPELPADTEEWLVSGLVKALPAMRLRELFELRRDMIVDADYLIVAVDKSLDQAIAILSSRWIELPSKRSCLHIMTQFVGEGYRHGTIFRRSWATHFTELLADTGRFPEILILKTYNPVAYCAMRAFSGRSGIEFYPEVGPISDPTMTELAGEIAGTVADGHPFDPATGVIAGIGVPVDLYDALPMGSVQPVNTYFVRHVRPGDRVLCVLRVSTVEGQRSILSALGVPAR